MTPRGDVPTLAAMLEAALAHADPEADSGAFDMARTSCRIPRSVLVEIGAVAQANRMSVSLVINVLLDSYLRAQGRPGYQELAPWYPDYVLRKTPGASQCPESTGE